MSIEQSELSYRRISGGLLVAGAAIGLVANPLHPHTAETDPAAALRAVADSGIWVGVHLAIIVAVLLVTGGLVGLAHLLERGRGAPLARLGLAAALVGVALVSASTAIDGFALKALAVDWARSTGGDSATALRVAAAARALNFGVWSVGMLVFFGAAFVCFGAAAAACARFPAWFGWIAVAGGAGSAVAALLQIADGSETPAAETLFFASSVVITLWLMALGIVLWRGGAARGRAAE